MTDGHQANQLSEEVKALVRGANFGHLATLMRDGAPHGLQGEEVRRARDSLEANMRLQRDVVTGLRGPVKKHRTITKRVGRCRFGARPNDCKM
jgi:hypothetical protein